MGVNEGYSVFIKHRPRRIAFLLDPNAMSLDVFTAIFDFSVDVWGGRHNPIIPVTEGNLYPDYWQLLKIVDPDVVYTYSDLSQATIERLDWEIGPSHILHHQERLLPGESPNYSVVLREQATTTRLILNLREKLPPYMLRIGEPSILNFEYSDIKKVSAFAHANFGVSHNSCFLVRDRNVSGVTPASTSDADIMRTIHRTNNLSVPMNLCADAPLERKANDGKMHDEFLICFGDDPWTIIHFWNEALFRNRIWEVNAGFNYMWIPPAMLNDQEAYRELLELIGKRVYGGSQQRALKVVSVDQDIETMREIGLKLCRESRANLYPESPEKLEKAKLPICEPDSFTEFALDKKPQEHQHVRGREIFLDINPLPEIDPERDKCWMMDVSMENAEQERYQANQIPWWMLPQRRSLCKVFTKSAVSRITIDKLLSVEVSGQAKTIFVQTPKLHSLFSSLILPESFYTWAVDLRHAYHQHHSKTTGVSDKGKYARGVISLFGSLRETAYFFEHPFWRSVANTLCLSPVSPQTQERVRSHLQNKLGELIGQLQDGDDAAVSWLTDEILEAGQHIPRGERFLTFRELRRLYQNYLENLPAENRKWVLRSRIRRDPDGLASEELERLVSRSLKTNISELTNQQVLLQGAELRCSNCISKLWYHVDEMKHVIKCRGCRSDIFLPAETEWAYAANDLVTSAVRYHGVVPVIRTLARLFPDSRACFLFAAGLEVWTYSSDSEKREFEVDLAFIRDGEFGLAEVTKTTKHFRSVETERLVRVASFVRPNTIVLAFPEGDDADLATIKNLVLPRLEPLNIKLELWGPGTFSRTSFHHME